MTSNSDLSIEIKIQDLNFLLPLHEDSTIATVTTQAFSEYTKVCRQNAPKKILYAKDALNRILTPELSILQLGIDRKLELVVDDYSKSESLNFSELQQVYRGWQLWSLAQISDTLHHCLSNDTPGRPDFQQIELLSEISKSNSEQVQLESIKLFKLLLNRFPQKETILTGAECIAAIFSSTSFVAVAVACIEAFKDMSPLQYRLFDGARLIREMHSVLLTLTRFPPESQVVLLTAFRSVAALLEDPDLLSQSADSDHLSTTLDKREEKKATDLVRLSALLQSEDKTVRRFALQKTYKLLNPANAPAPPIEIAESGSEDGNILAADAIPNLPLKSAEGLNKYSIKELRMIMQSLFSSIKKSICARSKPKLKDEPVAPIPAEVSKVKVSSEQSKNRLDLSSSTAGRLINSALQSPSSDFQAVLLGLSCLLLTVKCNLTERDDDDDYEFKSSMNSSYNQHSLVSGKLLLPAEVVLRDSAGESLTRLLLTLTHADEEIVLSNSGCEESGISRAQLKEIAECSAILFGIAASGWKLDPALKLELPVLCRFIDPASSPCRRMLALSYLTSMLPDTSSQPLLEMSLRSGCRLLRSLWLIASGDYQPRGLYRLAQLSAMQLMAELSACSPVGLFLRQHGAAQRLLHILKFCGRWRGDTATRMKIIDDLRRKSGDEEEVSRGIMAGAKEFEDSSDSDDDNEGALSATLFSGRTDTSALKGSELGNTSRSDPAELNSRRNKQQGDVKKFVKADIVLIRLVLKTIANSELSLSSERSPAEESHFKKEISLTLQNLSIFPAPIRNNRPNIEASNRDEEAGWKLTELAASDRVVNFYFNLLTSS